MAPSNGNGWVSSVVGGEQTARNQGSRTSLSLLLWGAVVGAGPEQNKDPAISRQEECIWGLLFGDEEEGGKEALCFPPVVCHLMAMLRS